MDSFITTLPIALLIGWLLDLWLGDPENMPHPVVYMGKWIAMGEKRLNKGEHRLLKGAIFALFSILLTFAIVGAIISSIWYGIATVNQTVAFIITTIIESIGVFYCLAGHTLRNEVRMVFEALDRSLEDGRKQVARIVGRDTQELSAQEVRTAALETLAENLSDGVIAPLFWFCLLGVPGMMMYKMINTLDSMIGYQNQRYKDFGCWAAHIDDIANYIPARLTAFGMVVCGWIYNKINHSLPKAEHLTEQIKFVLKNGPKHASPNSGWPESALAGMLDCQFGGTHNYFGEVFYKPTIGDHPRELNTSDMRHSIAVCLMTEIGGILLVGSLQFIVYNS